MPPADPHVRQAFISYCQKESDLREQFVGELKKQNLFTDIWIDKDEWKATFSKRWRRRFERRKSFSVWSVNIIVNPTLVKWNCFSPRTSKRKFSSFVLHKTFKIYTFDWLSLLVGSNQYYRLNDEQQMKKLFGVLRPDVASSKPVKVEKRPQRRPSVRKYQEKQVVNWTSDDIRHWCEDNQFEQWIPLLAHYDGQCLAKLDQHLSISTVLPNLASTNGLNLFEVTRFRCKLEQLLLRWATVQRSFHSNRRSPYRVTVS